MGRNIRRAARFVRRSSLRQPGPLLHPAAWQERNGRRTNIEIAYRLTGSTVGFVLGPYDRHLPLCIDPVVLVQIPIDAEPPANRAAHAIAFGADSSVYLAGSNRAWISHNGSTVTELGSDTRDKVEALAIDAAGNIHAAGTVWIDSAERGFQRCYHPSG